MIITDKEAQASISKDKRIKQLLHTQINNLSGGEKRWLELLLVLSLKKPFVLLDEPYSEVEPMYIPLINEKINSSNSAAGVIITDHQHQAVRAIATRLCIMANGTLHSIVNDDKILQQLGYLPEKK